MQQRRVAGGIRDIDPACKDRGRETIEGQGGAVRRAVDSVRAAGNHSDIALDQAGGQIRRHVLAVRRGGSRPDDRRGALGEYVEPGRSNHPQHERWMTFGVSAVVHTANAERQAGPFVIVGRDQSPAPPIEQIEILGGTVDLASRFGPPAKVVGNVAAPDTVGGLDRPTRTSIAKRRARWLGHPRQVRPAP